MSGYRGGRVELPVNITGLGRTFRLRLRVDALDGELSGLKPEMSWSSVLSPSFTVQVAGDGGSLRRYNKDSLSIEWYIGHDDLEVAPSSVLASVVYAEGHNLFRAVIHTTEDVYYVEPASEHPEVERACRFCQVY